MTLEGWIAVISLVVTVFGGLLGALYHGIRKRVDLLEKAVSELQQDTASFATTISVTDSIDKLRNQLLEQQSRSEDRVVNAMRDLKGYLDVRITDLLERSK